MAYSGLYNLPDGKLLQPYFSEGVRSQLSATFPEWKYVEMQKVHDGAAKQIQFELLSGYGPASIQMRNPNGSTDFPQKQLPSIAEYTAQLKTIEVTLSLNLEPRRYTAEKGTSYASADVIVMESKLKALKRHRSKQFYADGTGVMGQLVASPAVTCTAGLFTFVLSSADTARGHIGWFEKDDIMLLKAVAGTATAMTTDGTAPTAFRVVSRTHATNTVTMQAVDANNADLTDQNTVTVQPGAGEFFYRNQQPTIPNLSSVGTTDYGTISEEIVGLESLTANDGRVVHGITMTGFNGGSRFDAGAVQLTGLHIEGAMNNAEIAAGEGAYKYKQMLMSHQARTNLVEDRQASVHFISIKDDTLGTNQIKYQFRDQLLEAMPREFCPKTRIYVIPEGAEEKEKVIELYSSDVDPVVDKGGDMWRLEPSSSGGFARSWVGYMSGRYVLVGKHAAAIPVVNNFTLS